MNNRLFSAVHLWRTQTRIYKAGRLTLALTIGLLCATALDAQNGGTVNDLQTAYTMSAVNEILQAVSLGVLQEMGLDEDIPYDLADDSYLLVLANYIDLNVIGAGKGATLNPQEMVERISAQVRQGKSPDAIGLALVEDFKRRPFETKKQNEPQAQMLKTRIGVFFVNEFEHHQEPDGKFMQLLEINQTRIYFSSQLHSADGSSNLDFLAEWNPVPEEVVHHIDAIALARDGVADTLRLIENEIEGPVPFEQLHIRIGNIAGSGVDLTVGQFRNPFGIWSDYTSHRNFSSTKNNTLVNGFALKKIELGALLNKRLRHGIGIAVGLVHGRQSRTAPLGRADIDKKKDLVGRLEYTRGTAALGFSAYLGEARFNRNIAYGVDWLVSLDKLSLSGELVYQKNSKMNSTFGTSLAFNSVSAKSGYIQYDYLVSNKLHLYGFYEKWQYSADGKQINDPTYKVFHGLRYYLNRHLRWILVEYGRMFHNEFDDGRTHLSTQLELTY